MDDRDLEDKIAIYLTYESMEDYTPTKSQRRAESRVRKRLGMVKHNEPSVRPMKMPKPNVTVKG